MHRHLVAVKVRVERNAHRWRYLDREPFYQPGAERLNAQAMERGGAVQEYPAVLNDLLKDRPHFVACLLYQAVSVPDIVRKSAPYHFPDNERAEKFERHFFRQSAFVDREPGTDYDHRTAGVIHALAKQVLAEPPLFALQHIRQRSKRPPLGRHLLGSKTRGVVYQGVDRFLKHALLVLHNNFRSLNFQKLFQAVVPVDHTAIQIIQIRSCIPSAVQSDHRPKVRRQNRQNRHHEPLGPMIVLYHRLDHLEPPQEFYLHKRILENLEFFFHLLNLMAQIHVLQNTAHRLGTASRLEHIAEPAREVQIFRFA